MISRIIYKKLEDGRLRIKNDIIVKDKFYNAIIDPVLLQYTIDTPNGAVVGTASSLHELKKGVKRYLEACGARFKEETRAKRINKE